MKRLVWICVLAIGGCASTSDNSTKCVASPVVESTTEEVDSTTEEVEPTNEACDNEQVIGQKIEALRARHIAGELNEGQMFAQQGAVINQACFKKYLLLIEDDQSPMGIGPVTRLKRLKYLLDAEVITQKEFEDRKKVILPSL